MISRLPLSFQRRIGALYATEVKLAPSSRYKSVSFLTFPKLRNRQSSNVKAHDDISRAEECLEALEG